jgi:myo-inositol 2-dehydrogenase/D-chiro-inositol 1-dehydrogenase
MNVNRRTFVLGAAAGLASAQSSEPTLTGMIGIGNRGSLLLRTVLAQPGAKIAALCDIKPDRLDRAATAAARDNPPTYSDYRKILERKDITAVFIASPPYLHAEMAVAALKAGKNVYCEKPIGVTPTQVRAVVEAARGSKTVFTAGQQMRSSKQYQQAIAKIREGVIGDVIMVKAQRHAAADIAHDGSSGDWYFDVNKGGGYLIEQSVHNLDLCNWVIGAHPVRACGFGGTVLYKNDPPGRTIFDCASLTYEYPNGVKMCFTQNVFHPRGLPSGGQYVYVYGSKGAVDLMADAIMYPRGEGKPTPLAEKIPLDNGAHIGAFYACMKSGGPNPAGIEIGASAALTSILGHEAMVKEKVVTWADLAVNV